MILSIREIPPAEMRLLYCSDRRLASEIAVRRAQVYRRKDGHVRSIASTKNRRRKDVNS